MSDPRSGSPALASGTLLHAAAPPGLALPRPGSLDLGLLRVPDVRGAGLDPTVLDATERRRAAELAHGGDRIRFTAAHLALRQIEQRQYGACCGASQRRGDRCGLRRGPRDRRPSTGGGGAFARHVSRR